MSEEKLNEVIEETEELVEEAEEQLEQLKEDIANKEDLEKVWQSIEKTEKLLTEVLEKVNYLEKPKETEKQEEILEIPLPELLENPQKENVKKQTLWDFLF